jgi:predicted AAA+ superfamily ATPase
MDIQRDLRGPAEAVLKSRMAFIGGPRQVGKTTMALSLLGPTATPHHPG